MQASKRIGLVLTAAVAVAGSLSAQQPGDRRAAAVNGETILQSEVDAVLRATQPPSPTPLSEAQKRELQTSALNMLIEDMLMRQYLRKNAPAANPAEVDKRIQQIVTDLAKEKKSLNELLVATSQTEAQFRADVAARVQWEQFINPRLTDAVVKQYFDTNKVFFDKVLVRASHVLLKVAPNASQNDRQMVYNRIVAIRQEILQGKIQFADAAKKYSECPSKDNGGDIGLFPYKFAVLEPFAKAAFSMKIGDMSDVVATDFGFHVLKVTDRTQGQASDYEKIKAEVKEIYAQEIYQLVIAEQKRSAKIEVP